MWFSQKINRKFLLVLSLGCMTFGIGIDWGLPHAVNPETVAPWEIDAVAPIMPLNEAYYLFTRTGNEWVTYPLFHFLVLDIIYAPYLFIQLILGNLENLSSTFPYGMKDPTGICRDLTLLARLVSFSMALGIVIAVYKITEELFSPEAAFWSSFMTVILSPLTYYAKVANLDVPYIFWSLLAVLQYIRIMKTQSLINYVGFSIFATLAIATKDQAYGFFIIIPCVLIYGLARYSANGPVTLPDIRYAIFSKSLLLSVVMAVIVFSIANNLIFGGWSGFIRHIDHITGLGSQPWRMFPNTIDGQLSLLTYSINLLIQMLGYGSLILCVSGICYTMLKRKWLELSILIFPISYYIFFIGIIGYAYTRFLLGPSILLMPFSGVFIANLLACKNSIRVWAKIGILGCFLWQAMLTADLIVTQIMDSRYEAETWIKAHIPPGAIIESQVSHERLLPHISGDYKISMKGQSEMGPVPEELSAKALKERDPQYILLGSLGFSHDPESWQDASLKEYRDALLSGRLGYSVLAKFETPHLIPRRQITGTKPTFILLGKSSGVHNEN